MFFAHTSKMASVTRTLHKVSSFQKTFSDHKWELISRVNFSSAITPIKMAFSVYQSATATDQNTPPLIIMHGLLGSRHNFRTICKGLENKIKGKIYNVDARNHGDSPHDPAHSPAHMSADIAFLMQEENLNRASVLGYCMGGRTMMYFTLNYPQLVEKTIIVDISPVSVSPNRANLNAMLTVMKSINIPRTMSRTDGRAAAERQLNEALGNKKTVQFILLNLKKLKTGEFVWRANITALYESFKQVQVSHNFSETPAYSGPVLFIGGKKSKFLNPDDWPKIKQIFPKADLKWIDCDHLIHLSEPDKFMDLVADFLNS